MTDETHAERLQRLRETEIFAVSSSACFYPELSAPEEFDGSTITWTFELPKSTEVGAGVYALRFIRTLAEEEALGNAVLASADTHPKDGDVEQAPLVSGAVPTGETPDE